eukprot:GHVR01109059.1.p1 GENE.GHVR01109059.1~~GHVR01109059.1.p1  ORF type:complete len:237 (+),score=93.70 GHVR01109059.1:230-940(+)
MTEVDWSIVCEVVNSYSLTTSGELIMTPDECRNYFYSNLDPRWIVDDLTHNELYTLWCVAVKTLTALKCSYGGVSFDQRARSLHSLCSSVGSLKRGRTPALLDPIMVGLYRVASIMIESRLTEKQMLEVDTNKLTQMLQSVKKKPMYPSHMHPQTHTHTHTHHQYGQRTFIPHPLPHPHVHTHTHTHTHTQRSTRAFVLYALESSWSLCYTFTSTHTHTHAHTHTLASSIIKATWS